MTNVSRFKIGDRVITKYNQHGTVTGRSDEFVQVQVDGLQYDGGWYESSLRFETPVPAPVNPESKFQVGDRVITKYNQHGTVTGHADRYTQVQVDGQLYDGGWYESSLRFEIPDRTPDLTPNQQAISQPSVLEQVTGARAKYAGQSAAISKNSEVYRIAKDIAVELGRNWKQVNIDMVQGVLVGRGYKAADLGNAAGAIFRGENWKNAGTTYLSRRESNHARKITVWQYVGN
jgi:preprotein translocase subunit YajC